MADLHAFWIENLRKYHTMAELRRSPFFLDFGERIESYLRTPQIIEVQAATPRLESFVRVVQWNIEKGKRLDAIIETLDSDETLRWADVILLNEADCGMLRSGNRHVARELAERLGMHAVFGPAHLELTKGTGEELALEGANRESLQGNAILSRHPVSEARTVPLPVSFEPYEFFEKRFGWRSCLWAKLELPAGALWVGAVHLELRNTPHCRLLQMRHVIEHLPDGGKGAFLIGGDLNVNGFPRGNPWRTFGSALRLILSSPDAMKQRLLHPEAGGEPLFAEVTRNGFSWEGLNSSDETARAALDGLDEADGIPAPIMNLARRRLAPYQGRLCFKLDWLFGRNVGALGAGERPDARSGVASVSPGVASTVHWGDERISDHKPIYADIEPGPVSN